MATTPTSGSDSGNSAQDTSASSAAQSSKSTGNGNSASRSAKSRQPATRKSSVRQASVGQSGTRNSGSNAGAASKIEGYLDRQLQVVADDLENFANMLVDAFDENSDNLPQSFRSAVDPLSNRVAQLADLLREQDTRRLVERTRRTFADHPVAVVGGLAAVAAALGQIAVVAARRSDSRGNGSSRKLNA